MKLNIILFSTTLAILFLTSVEKVHAVKINRNIFIVAKDTCDSAGVFLTHDDYLNRKLTSKINPNRRGNKITFSLNHNDIKIISHDSIAIYKAGSVYGYYNCGERFRYSKKGYYTIIEKSPLVIYTTSVNNFSGMTEVKYFYSLKSDSEIRSLTMKNIEKDFKDKPAFINEVKNQFKWWSGLAATDDNGKLLLNELWGDYKNRNE